MVVLWFYQAWNPLCDFGNVSPSRQQTSLERSRWQMGTSATPSEKSAVTNNVHAFLVSLSAQISSCFITDGSRLENKGFSPDFVTSFELVLINRSVIQHNSGSVLLE